METNVRNSVRDTVTKAEHSLRAQPAKWTGVAIGAGVGAGVFKDFREAFKGLHIIGSEEGTASKSERYLKAYSTWKSKLNQYL